MHENEIENELKLSADKISVKSFKDRWDGIKDRVLTEQENESILIESPVLCGIENNGINPAGNSKRNSLLVAGISIILLCCAALAVTLPLTLLKKETVYFSPSDLTQIIVDEERFFNEINTAGYEIIDFSGLEAESYTIFTTTNSGEIKGGQADASVKATGSILYVTFYDKTVNCSDYDYFEGYDLYKVNSTEIKYITQQDETTYTTEAYAKHKNLTYHLVYLSLSNDCTSLFNELFQ